MKNTFSRVDDSYIDENGDMCAVYVEYSNYGSYFLYTKDGKPLKLRATPQVPCGVDIFRCELREGREDFEVEVSSATKIMHAYEKSIEGLVLNILDNFYEKMEESRKATNRFGQDIKELEESYNRCPGN